MATNNFDSTRVTSPAVTREVTSRFEDKKNLNVSSVFKQGQSPQLDGAIPGLLRGSVTFLSLLRRCQVWLRLLTRHHRRKQDNMAKNINLHRDSLYLPRIARAVLTGIDVGRHGEPLWKLGNLDLRHLASTRATPNTPVANRRSFG